MRVVIGQLRVSRVESTYFDADIAGIATFIFGGAVL